MDITFTNRITNRFLFFIVIVSLYLITTPSFALALFDRDYSSQNYFYFVYSRPTSSAYDAMTQMYTATLSGQAGLFEAGSVLSSADIFGTLSLSAMIDNGGNFLSGSVVWTGESADLGIASGSMLMQGTLTDSFYEKGDPLTMQFLINVDNQHSNLSLTDTLGLALFHSPTLSVSDQFSISFRGYAYSGSELWNIDTSVSEPVTSLLFAIGFMAFVLNRKRYFR